MRNPIPANGRLLWAYYKHRVATAEGKQGIRKCIFPDRENTGNLLKNIKNIYVFTQGIYHQHRENSKELKKNELVI